MNTTRNRSAVLAQFLRAAARTLRRSARYSEKEAALATIDGVAEELEAAANDQPTDNIPRTGIE